MTRTTIGRRRRVNVSKWRLVAMPSKAAGPPHRIQDSLSRCKWHTAYKFNEDRAQTTSVPMVPRTATWPGPPNRALLAAQRFALENMQKKAFPYSNKTEMLS
ncbi:hypothetical protein FHS25_000677 [Rhizobium laguerreae]|uniref:Transposase n=1 Tax=Rhizobium laguerreae TaxID=1076926 RepID=A0AAX2QRX4_9HYPH|nr:hypothetical protein [Rhizobium laguerreae]TCU28409.1 hypothetical protein EV131_102241 [Rhizobium laguerreae]